MTPDVKCLINCCKTNPTASDIEQIRSHIIQLDNQQLSKLITLAHAHGIFPLVYHSLHTLTSDLLSDEDLKEFKRQNMTIVMQNMLMTAELIRIMKLLEDNGIEALAFKGPTLAQLAYGDIALRQYCDIDVLINVKDAYKTAALLNCDTYKPMDSIEFLKNEAKLNVEKNYEFYNRNNAIKLEIHWQLINTIFLPKFNDYDVWIKKQSVFINKTLASTLDTEILLIYLCNHGAVHMWERIEWILDIDQLVKSQDSLLDWERILKTSKQLNCYTALLLGLKLAHLLFNTQLPKNILKKFENHPTVPILVDETLSALNNGLIFHDHTSTVKNLEVFSFHLGMQDTIAAKLIFIMKTIFSYSDRDVMLINLPKPLYVLYYPLRIFRITYKYTVDPLKKLFIQASY